jgi:ethanolamine-phosphate cytidylyltransferase
MSEPNGYSKLVIVAAVGVPALAVFGYWLSWKSYDFIPLRYQYVPGTITGWLSQWLHKYSKKRRSQRPVRVYLDGCFDLMHYGHANALRQAKTLGDVLVVGVNPDDDIKKYKGPPVMNNEERCSLVEAVKWVDEVIPLAPYVLTKDVIQMLFTQHKIDYIVHGDDPCLLPDGTDAYDYPKKIGRFRMVKRTEGVSTTDIVGRMLMCGRTNRLVRAAASDQQRTMLKHFGSSKSGELPGEDAQRISSFLPTSSRIVQFATGAPAAAATAKVVYIDGAFDLFHMGHLSIIKRAKQEGEYLIVGVHSDEAVKMRRGPHLPIMSVHERCLSVLACKHVDEVIIGVFFTAALTCFCLEHEPPCINQFDVSGVLGPPPVEFPSEW